MKQTTALLLLTVLSCRLAAQTDTIPPVIQCKQNLSTTIQPTGLITLWAADFVDTVYDNSTLPVELGVRKPCMGTGFPEQNSVTHFYVGWPQVEVWAKDQSGNTSSCLARVLIGDLGNTEPPMMHFTVVTPEDQHISEVLLKVFATHCTEGNFELDVVTQAMWWGAAIWDAPEPGAGVTISASKSLNALNGITTYDLVLIMRHILGVEPFASPYQLIAADANLDGKITNADVVMLRELVLGIRKELPHGKSWRFIPADYEFSDLMSFNTTAFCECISIPKMPDPQLGDFSFTGIKIGDVNFSADPKQ
ncbi:MAG: hypothetical protein JNJ57_08140 [Saprospiraceae bacterium]|nr:hypothetical protein [Saprospiraceae bacterium]